MQVGRISISDGGGGLKLGKCEMCSRKKIYTRRGEGGGEREGGRRERTVHSLFLFWLPGSLSLLIEIKEILVGTCSIANIGLPDCRTSRC